MNYFPIMLLEIVYDRLEKLRKTSVCNTDFKQFKIKLNSLTSKYAS